MIGQSELLKGTNIATDDDVDYQFTPADENFLAVAEGVVSVEWHRIANYLGLTATAGSVSEQYDSALQVAGRWDLDHPTKEQLER